MQDGNLIPVTDPELIALLEQPQSAISKQESEGGAGGQAAYSQSALDAFDRAIDSARRLRNHKGLGSAVGSWLDPQAWGAVNMLTTPDLEKGQKPADQYYRGTAARDFASQLDAMRAQIFLPMVQSMKGMGALSNAEGQKLADAIGALDPGMSEDAFVESLDRIITDLTAYRDRGKPQEVRGTTPAAPTEDRETKYAVAAPAVQISDDGSSDVSNPATMAYVQRAQELFNKGGSRADFDVLSAQYGFPPYGADLDEAIKNRNATGALARILPPEQEGTGPTLIGTAAASAPGASAIGFANAMTGGTLDNIVGALGGDQQKAQWAKEASRAAHPGASFLGEVAGGMAAMSGINRIPALAGRALAADIAYGAAYGAGENEENRLGGAVVGGVAGAAGNYIGGKLLQRLSAAPKPSASAQAYGRAQEYGIDLPMGATGRARSFVEKGLDVMPGSAGVMEGGREALRTQVGNAVEDVADRYGTANSYGEIGDAIQRGARQWIDRFRSVSSKAYEAIPISPNAPASLTATQQALTDLNSRFASNPDLARVMSNSRLSQFMDALGDKSSKLSWQDLKAFRSVIGEQIGDFRFSDGTLTSDMRRLYAALSDDMRNTAAAKGPEALRRFERANTLYRQGEERIDGALRNILGNGDDLKPEAAAAFIERVSKANKNSSDIRRLAGIRASMPREEWNEVAGGLIRLAGQPLNSPGREFNPATFVQAFADMAPPAKNLLFGDRGRGELRQALEGFTEVMGDLAANNATRNMSNTAGATNAIAAIALGPSVLFSPPAAGALAAQTVGSFGLAKLWTDPAFVRWATGFAKMQRGAARAGGQPNVSRQLELLGKLARSQPIIATEALGLQRQLSAAFSPTRLAADEGTGVAVDQQVNGGRGQQTPTQ